jgi:hypothetical protein
MDRELLNLLFLYAGGLWLFYFASIYSTDDRGVFSRTEAKAKAVFTAFLSLGVLAFAIHWAPAATLFVLAFVAYFVAKKHFRPTTRDEE